MMIEDTKVIPGFTYNIVSLQKLLKQRYMIMGDIKKMKLVDIKTGKLIQFLRERVHQDCISWT
jgi:hypothetical protein